MKVEIYDTDNYKNINDARKDGATSVMNIPSDHIDTVKIVLEKVLEAYGKDEIGIDIEKEIVEV